MSEELRSPAEVEVDTIYTVPCVPVLDTLRNHTRWVPVLLPSHADPELGAPYDHYHFDFRFCDERLLKFLRVSARGGHVLPAVPGWGHVVQGSPRPRGCLCVRKHSRFPVVSGEHAGARFRRLEDQWSEHTLPSGCRTCPHKGMPLDAGKVCGSRGQSRVCPGHGLRWNLETGRLERRHSKRRTTDQKEPAEPAPQAD